MAEVQKEETGAKVLDPSQVATAARAGLTILGHDACLIPNKIRDQVAVLENILAGMSSGELIVATNPGQGESVPSKPPAKKAPRRARKKR